MNKKAYQMPAMQVTELEMQTVLLAGSGVTPNGGLGGDDEIINSGSVQARPHYGVWE